MHEASREDFQTFLSIKTKKNHIEIEKNIFNIKGSTIFSYHYNSEKNYFI